MHLTAAALAAAAVAACIGGAASRAAAEPVVACEWDFANGEQGWLGANCTRPVVQDGALTYEATAGDVLIVSPTIAIEPRFGDVLEITLRSTSHGTAEWFWRANTEGRWAGFEPSQSCRFELPASDEWQTLRVWPFWHDLPQIVGLRFDGPEPILGKYEVRSIRVLRMADETPVPADFDFAGDERGWSVTGGTVAPNEEGLKAHLSGDSARLVSPRLALRGEEAPWLVLDLTAPPSDGTGQVWPAVLEWLTPEAKALRSTPFRVAPGRRQIVNLQLSRQPDWKGEVVALMLGVITGGPCDLVLHSLRVADTPGGAAGAGRATGLEFQTTGWRQEYRLPHAPVRIDVATTAPPETRPVPSDYTVSMWYFAAWEPEYTWDGWKQVAERSPWRIPLLYDSQDDEMAFNGIRFYRSSNPRVVDWHVHWMREHAVNLMLWDWYPGVTAEGEFDPGFMGNRALELGFLGKSELGGPRVETNRFAETMPFAIMWTNHPPMNAVGRGLAEYIVDQFLTQPNYYKIDGKPLVAIWHPRSLVEATGSEEAAKAKLDHLREVAVARGLAGVYIASVCDTDRAFLDRLGVDGVTGYNLLMTGGFRQEARAIGDRAVTDYLEDFATQTTPGQEATWNRLADAWGPDYLLATMPMQNFEPTFRPGNPIVTGNTPDAYREMLRRAVATIEARGLRRFINIEAWNEWLEGSYVEPSTQWGMGYLEAIRDVLGKAEQ